MDRTDPTGEATTCVTDAGGHKQCTMTADTFNAKKSNHQTSVPSAAVRAAAEAGKSKVAVHDGFQEKLGFIVKESGGKPVVQVASDTKTADTSAGSTASAKIPAGAPAVIHGHIDAGPGESNGMVDDPSSNGGLGDSQPLKGGSPNATVSEGQIGWHQIVSGQLQFTFAGGALSFSQAETMQQQHLNEEQQQFKES